VFEGNFYDFGIYENVFIYGCSVLAGQY
jgi:hypothetical protein